jgi:hypothetical protein
MQEFEMKRKITQAGKRVGLIAVGAALFIFLLILNPFVKIDAGERGIVMNFGAVQDDVLGEGLHLRVPVMQKIVKMDVKIQKSETRSEAASKDLQDIKSVIALNYHNKANWVYQNIGVAFKERIIDPTVQEAVKAVTAKYTAVQLIGEREAVSTAIKDALSEKLPVRGRILGHRFQLLQEVYRCDRVEAGGGAVCLEGPEGPGEDQDRGGAEDRPGEGGGRCGRPSPNGTEPSPTFSCPGVGRLRF